MAVLVGGVGLLAGRIRVLVGGARVGVVGASSMTMSVIEIKKKKMEWCLKL